MPNVEQDAEKIKALRIEALALAEKLGEEATLVALAKINFDPEADDDWSLEDWRRAVEALKAIKPAEATQPKSLENIGLSHANGEALSSNPPADATPEPETKPKSELHKAALDYLAQGYKLIPIVPGAKVPLRKDWRNAKLKTAEEVDALFADGQGYNIAHEPEDQGLAIIDVDSYHEGYNVDLILDLPPTFEVITPRGGTHYYFKGSVPTTVGDESKPDKGLGPHIDTRGRGSYALLPPSVVDGKRYEVKADRAIVALPAEIVDKLKPRAEAAKADPDMKPDLPGNIARARDRLLSHVKNGRVAIEGKRGHDTCYEVACELVRDLGLSTDTALGLMLEIWYPHCEPNNDPAFVRERVLSAWRNGQNDPGAYAANDPQETFADYKQEHQDGTTERMNEGEYLLRPTTFGALFKRSAPPRQWLIPGLVPKHRATPLTAHGGANKSRLGHQWGLSLQAGISVFGFPIPIDQCTYVYLDYENGIDETTLRSQQMRHRLGLPEEMGGRYFDYTGTNSVDADPFVLEGIPPLLLISEEVVSKGELYDPLLRYLRDIPGHKFILADSLDDFIFFAGQSKNNTNLARTALRRLDRLCIASDSSMLYLSHPSYSGLGREDMSSFSTAFHNLPRHRLALRKDDKADNYELEVVKSNIGVTGLKIALRWQDGVLVPLSQINLEDRAVALYDACIAAALQAWKRGQPIKRNYQIEPFEYELIKKAVGYGPKRPEITTELERAILAKRLQYVNAYGKIKAGYYPPETDRQMLKITGVDNERDYQRRQEEIAAAVAQKAKPGAEPMPPDDDTPH